MVDRANNEDGWAGVTAIILTALMLVMGLALLSIVDTQAKQSRTERVTDSSFNLAEGALNAEAFLLSRNWPTTAPANSSCSTTASINGTLGDTSAVKRILTDSFTNGDYATSSTWKLNVCDDTNSASDSWSDSKLSSGYGYDQNNNGKLWVRAQTTVRGQARAVAALVVVQRPPIMPAGYAVLGGGVATELTFVTNTLLSNSALLSPLTSSLLGQYKLVSGGKVGVRCGLSSLCADGVFTGLSSTAIGPLLLSNDWVQYGSTTAANDDTIAGLRSEAQVDGTYLASVASNGNCIPAGAASTAVVFVELVGNGDQTCNVTLAGNQTLKMLVVANGRIHIGGTGVLTSVVYGLNRQRLTLTGGDDRTARGCASLVNLASNACETVRVDAPAEVKGAVYADGATGDVGIYPSYTATGSNCTANTLTGLNLTGLLPAAATSITTSASICSANELSILNGGTPTLTVKVDFKVLGIPASVNVNVPVGLSNVTNPQTLLTSVLTDVHGPAVLYDKPTVDVITGFGSSGTVAGTFRAIPPN